MEAESRDVHVLDRLGGLERRQLHAQTFRMRGLNAGQAPRLIELPQPFVPERLDHERSIACCASRNKCRAQCLADRDQIIPSPELGAVQKVHPKISENGVRPPTPVEWMPHVYFLQLWFNLSRHASPRTTIRSGALIAPQAAGQCLRADLSKYTTNDIFDHVKPLDLLGDSLDVLRAFPDGARRAAGFQLDRLQRGLEPLDWKPMSSIGPGVQEIRVREKGGAFRVIYLARLPEAVYVIHCFQKKTQRTPQRELDLARRRLSELMRTQR